MSDKRKKIIRELMVRTGKSYQWVANRYDKGMSPEGVFACAVLEAPVPGACADVVVVDEAGLGRYPLKDKP